MTDDTLIHNPPVNAPTSDETDGFGSVSCDQEPDCEQMYGINANLDPNDPEAAELRRLYINLKLASSGQPWTQAT